MAPKKPTHLTLDKKMMVIRLSNKGMTSRRIAEKMNVGRTQIQNILKKRAAYEEDYDNNFDTNRKQKNRSTEFEDINRLLFKWFSDVSSQHVVVTGPMLKEKALKFASELGYPTFKASNGWLESFKARNKIVFRSVCGEAGAVNEEISEQWMEKLPGLIESFSPRNILNMDETGIFFRDSGCKKSFVLKNQKCTGGKRSKDRITVVVCSNMVGEREKLTVIGKSAKPRCFGRLDVKKLPVSYRYNKKAWMTTELMKEWLISLNKKMVAENREVILFLDNAPVHPHLSLSNIKLQFFPPGTTAKLQPMDAGIIQTLKLKFRKRQLSYILHKLDTDTTSTGAAILRTANILQAINWLSASWRDVLPETIMKCFKSCGFTNFENAPEDPPLSSEEDSPDLEKLSAEIFGVPVSDAADVDKAVSTCDSSTNWERSADEILQEGTTDLSSEESEDEEIPHHLPSTSEAQEMVEKLMAFATDRGDENMLTSLVKVEELLIQRKGRVQKQMAITDFFTKETTNTSEQHE